MLIKAVTNVGAGVRYTLASDDDLLVAKGVSVCRRTRMRSTSGTLSIRPTG